jgi:hypothetical protein
MSDSLAYRYRLGHVAAVSSKSLNVCYSVTTLMHGFINIHTTFTLYHSK